MHKGFKKIFWGIFIATFNFRIGSIKILPSFIGFFIIMNGMNILFKSTSIKKFDSASKFSGLIAVVMLLGEVACIIVESSNNILFNELYIMLISVLEILIFYNCIEGIIIYINNNKGITKTYIAKQRFYIIFATMSTIFINVSFFIKSDYFNIIVGIISIVLRIYLMTIFSGAKKIVNEN